MSGIDFEKWDHLGELVTVLMSKKEIPGVAVGITRDGETQTAGFGITNLDHPLPVTDSTLFQIGSITKTLTGMAMMQLVEQGKLDLDGLVRSYVPDFQLSDETVASKVTLRHLLTHTGGWEGDFFHDTGSGSDALQRYVAAMSQLEQVLPLGEIFSYNNAGFCLAGLIIESVTGKGYDQFLKESILDQIGLSASFFEPGEVIPHRFAVGHTKADVMLKVALPWPLPRSSWPAGGLICSIQDLLGYARFVLGHHQEEAKSQVLSSETMKLMQTPQVGIWGNEALGLTWAIDDSSGKRILHHGGGTNGQIAYLTLAPEYNFALAVLTNSGQGSQLTNIVQRWVYQQFLGLNLREATPVQTEEKGLRSYVGCYSRPFADFELGLLCGRLVVQFNPKGGFPTKDTPPPPPPPPMTIAPCAEDRLLVLDGPYRDATMDVIRTQNGSILGIQPEAGSMSESGKNHQPRQLPLPPSRFCYCANRVTLFAVCVSFCTSLLRKDRATGSIVDTITWGGVRLRIASTPLTPGYNTYLLPEEMQGLGRIPQFWF